MAEEQGKLVIELRSSRSSCAGAAASYLLRRIAARAGSYAPGIQENLFYEIGARSNGRTLANVEQWVKAHSQTFSALGYYFIARRMSAMTNNIKGWVNEGDGFRAAVLMTDGMKLHKNKDMSEGHPVGLMFNDPTSGLEDEGLPEGLLMVDAWPTMTKFAPPLNTLEVAHRAQKYRALLLFWAGYG